MPGTFLCKGLPPFHSNGRLLLHVFFCCPSLLYQPLLASNFESVHSSLLRFLYWWRCLCLGEVVGSPAFFSNSKYLLSGNCSKNGKYISRNRLTLAWSAKWKEMSAPTGGNHFGGSIQALVWHQCSQKKKHLRGKKFIDTGYDPFQMKHCCRKQHERCDPKTIQKFPPPNTL